MAIDYNKIVWVCPKCGTWTSELKGTTPNNDGHCTNCPGTLVETKYTYGNYLGMPGYQRICL